MIQDVRGCSITNESNQKIQWSYDYNEKQFMVNGVDPLAEIPFSSIIGDSLFEMTYKTFFENYVRFPNAFVFKDSGDVSKVIWDEALTEFPLLDALYFDGEYNLKTGVVNISVLGVDLFIYKIVSMGDDSLELELTKETMDFFNKRSAEEEENYPILEWSKATYKRINKLDE